jgi:hypothetical protein
MKKKERVFGIRKENVVFERVSRSVCVMQQKFERDHSREYARRYQSCDGEERKGKAEKVAGVGIIRGRVHMHARVNQKTGFWSHSSRYTAEVSASDSANRATAEDRTIALLLQKTPTRTQ